MPSLLSGINTQPASLFSLATASWLRVLGKPDTTSRHNVAQNDKRISLLRRNCVALAGVFMSSCFKSRAL